MNDIQKTDSIARVGLGVGILALLFGSRNSSGSNVINTITPSGGDYDTKLRVNYASEMLATTGVQYYLFDYSGNLILQGPSFTEASYGHVIQNPIKKLGLRSQNAAMQTNGPLDFLAFSVTYAEGPYFNTPVLVPGVSTLYEQMTPVTDGFQDSGLVTLATEIPAGSKVLIGVGCYMDATGYVPVGYAEAYWE